MQVCHHLRNFSKYEYRAVQEPDLMVFSDSDQDALDKILDAYGNLTQYELEDLSHRFPEWLAYKDKIEAEDGPKAYRIDLDYFFGETEDESVLFSDDPEKLTLIKEMFHEFPGC